MARSKRRRETAAAHLLLACVRACHPAHLQTYKTPSIEQVFDTVNSMLRRNPAARLRGLRLATYKVVPLSPQSGVLEWVDNTAAFAEFLCVRSLSLR